MVFDPQDPQVLYLATEYAGILKSADSGKTFAAMNRGFVNHSLTQITGSGDRLYASSIYEGRHGGVFQSIDGGLDWTLRANEEALSGRNLNGLVAVPLKRDLLFASSQNEVLKSVDGGKTWARLIVRTEADSGPRRATFRSHPHPILTGGSTRQAGFVCRHTIRTAS